MSSQQQQQQQQQQQSSSSFFDFTPQYPQEDFTSAPTTPNLTSERVDGIGGGGGGNTSGSAGSLNGAGGGGESPAQRYNNPNQHSERLIDVDSPENSPVKSYSQPIPIQQQQSSAAASPSARSLSFTQPPDVNNNSSPSHLFSKPVLPPPPSQQQQQPSSSSQQAQSPPVHGGYSHPGTGQRTTSYGSTSSQQDPSKHQNQNTNQNQTQTQSHPHSPVHNFNKPTPPAHASPVQSQNPLPYPNQHSNHFPMPPTPVAAPNQTPAFNQSYPPPSSVTSNSSQPPLYSNHREAQPAQHAGWIDQSAGDMSMRSLQEGSVIERGAAAAAANRRNPSANRATGGQGGNSGGGDAGVIQRPTPPQTQQSSGGSGGNTSGNYSEQDQEREKEREREIREREQRERERDRQWEREQERERDRDREQPAFNTHASRQQQQQQQQQQPASPPYIKGTFNYQQHLQRQILSGSTSPRGRLGYQPPPLPASVLQQQPKNTSPLSTRELYNKPVGQSSSSGNVNTPPHTGSSPSQQYSSNQSQSQPAERKPSFGASQSPNAGAGVYTNNASSSSPHNPTQSPPVNYSGGSPHGSGTNSRPPARNLPYSPPQAGQPSPHREQEKDRKRQQEQQEREWEREQQQRDLPPLNTQRDRDRDSYHHPHPLLTPLPDGPAPPPAPSVPPPDTPGSEFGSPAMGPSFLKQGGYRGLIGLGLMGKKLRDTREDGEGGTPTGFLGRRGHMKKNSDERGGPPPLGKRTGSVGSGLGKGERPGSAEEDDPIPTEYRPQKRIDEDVNENENEGKRGDGNKKGLGLGYSSTTGPPTQQTISTGPQSQSQPQSQPQSQSQSQSQPQPPSQSQSQPQPQPQSHSQSQPHPPSGISPKAQQGYGRPPMQTNPSQRSPAEVGLGNYLYSKPSPAQQMSPGNSSNPNPRFPGANHNHHVTSPLSGGGSAGSATSPNSNNGGNGGSGINTGSTRESVMRGQWADTTAAVARPVQQQEQQQPGWFDNNQQRVASGGSQPSIPQGPPPGPPPPPQHQQNDYGGDSGPFKAFTQNLQKPLLSQQQPMSSQSQQQQSRRVHIHSPPNFMDDDDNDDQGTNPSESATPEPRMGNHQPPRVGSDEEVLYHGLRDLLPQLPSEHIQSLLTFALYLCDDAVVAEKANNVHLTGTGDLGHQLAMIREKRLRRWKEWVGAEEMERGRQVGLTPGHSKKKDSGDSSNPFDHDSSDDEDREEGGLGYEGMQPLPPPPRLPEIENLDLKTAGMDAFGGRQHGYQQHHQHQRGNYDLAREQTPSPTPTIDQVANAPKVDLELQMPRPVPSVPAIRIDPSARRRLYDDDASTVVSEAQSKGGDNEQIGQPGATPFPVGYKGHGGSEYRPIDTKPLSSIITAFNRGNSGNGDGNGIDASSSAEIPQFLHMAYAALDTAVNSPSLDTYLSEARRALENVTSQRLHQFQNESHQRRQRTQAHTAQLYNTGRFTFADIERMRDEFEQEEARRKMDVDTEIYHIFENEYVEVAYKDVKGQLEVLGGKWYEEVKLWLLNASSRPSTSEGTALEYHLLLEAIDLLNKLHITMEEHEHVLQSLVSDRNARYLQVSIQPLLSVGETIRAADAERRFWMDESERQLRGKMEAVKRGKEHEKGVERVVGEVVKGLRGRFRVVVDGVYAVIFQFPPSVLPQLFRRFFDDHAGTNIGSPGLPQEHSGSPASSFYTIPKEVMQIMVDAVQTLGEIVGLIKLAMDFQNAPQIRVCEATTALQVAEEHAHSSGVTAPTTTAEACSQGLALRLPAALKRAREAQIEQGEKAMGEMMEALRKLQNFLTTVSAKGGRIDFIGVAPPPMAQSQSQQSQQSHQSHQSNQSQHTPQQQQHTHQHGGQQLPILPMPPMVQVGQQQNWNGGSGEGEWGYGRGGGLGGVGLGGGQPGLSTMIGGLRAGQMRGGGANSLLISPGGYTPSGYSPSGASVWNSPY